MNEIAQPTITEPRRVTKGSVGHSTLRRRTAQTTLLYAGLLVLAIGLVLASSRPDVQALALGVAIPGGGFLAQATPLGVSLFAASAVTFVVALGLWFATGNVVLPVIVWLGSAIVAAVTAGLWLEHDVTRPLRPLLVALPAAMS